VTGGALGGVLGGVLGGAGTHSKALPNVIRFPSAISPMFSSRMSSKLPEAIVAVTLTSTSFAPAGTSKAPHFVGYQPNSLSCSQFEETVSVSVALLPGLKTLANPRLVSSWVLYAFL